MKSFTMLLMLLGLYYSASCQNQNTIWDENSPIGIGTDNPEENLDVKGVLQLRREDDSDESVSNSSVLSFQTVDENKEHKTWKLQSINIEVEEPYLIFYRNLEDIRLRLNSGFGWAFYREEKVIEMYSDGEQGGGIYIPGDLSVGNLNTANLYSAYLSSDVGNLSIVQHNNHQFSLSGNFMLYRSKGGTGLTGSAHVFTVQTPLTASGSNIASFSNGGADLVRIDKNGDLYSSGNISTTAKIKIGADSLDIGTHSLAVNGSAIFTKALVKLNGNWPDYVFETDYPLADLKSIESFILEHKHLPGVPSAKEVAKSGIDLGETQAILLKKIEELTLYIIAQDKRISELEKQLNKE